MQKKIPKKMMEFLNKRADLSNMIGKRIVSEEQLRKYVEEKYERMLHNSSELTVFLRACHVLGCEVVIREKGRFPHENFDSDREGIIEKGEQ